MHPGNRNRQTAPDITIYYAPYAGSQHSTLFRPGDDPWLSTAAMRAARESGSEPAVDGLYDPLTMDPRAHLTRWRAPVPVRTIPQCDRYHESLGANAAPVHRLATICKNTGIYDLFTSLRGQPDTGGTWTAPGGGPSNGQFIRTLTNGGIYTYTVDAVASGAWMRPSQSVVVGFTAKRVRFHLEHLFKRLARGPLQLLDGSREPHGHLVGNGFPFDGTGGRGGALSIDYADQPCLERSTAFTRCSPFRRWRMPPGRTAPLTAPAIPWWSLLSGFGAHSQNSGF